MQIKYNSSHLPHWERRDKLTHDQEVFIALLEDDQEFENIVLKIRDDYGIPTDGWSDEEINQDYAEALVKKFQGKRIVFDKATNKRSLELAGMKDDLALLYSDCESLICRLYDLPSYWISSIACFVAFSILPLPTKLNSIGLFPKESPQRWYAEESRNLLIAIDQRVSRKQIKDWLDQNGEGIDLELKKLPEQPKPYLPNIEIYKEIAYWRDTVPDLPASEIAKKLKEKNKNWNYTYAEVNTMFSRYKMALTKLKFKKKS